MRSHTRAPRMQHEQQQEQQRVLVAAADARLGALVSAGLRPRSWSVTAAPAGAAALEAAVLRRPHLIVLEAGHGGSAADGTVTAERGFLRAYRETPPPHAPVILIVDSAHTGTRDDAAGRGRAVGAAATLVRPFALLRLLETVERCAPRRALG